MMHRPEPAIRPVLLLIAVLGSFLGPVPARADFDAGVVALMQGDYQQALATFLPLASTSNHAMAQYFVGRMHAEGQGVARDAAAAAQWYRKAADQGVADAQLRLGELYASGDGVPRDLEAAWAWFGIAQQSGSSRAAAQRERLTAQLTEAERTHAEALVRQFMERRPEAGAAPPR